MCTSVAGLRSGRICRVNIIRLEVGVRIFAVILTAATLAACAQSSIVRDKSTSYQATPETTTGLSRTAVARPTARHVAGVRKIHVATRRVAASRQKHTRLTRHGGMGSREVASFYEHDAQTANGEKFDPGELTAAHRTLPFGTRVRVTNLANGRSVTVRINDRGPFIRGRTVDVSSSAAKTLQMTERGVVNVKLDIVEKPGAQR
jgi:rare lipoprotein A